MREIVRAVAASVVAGASIAATSTGRAILFIAGHIRRTGAVLWRATVRAALAGWQVAVVVAVGVARAVARRWHRMSAPSFFVASFATLIAIGTVGLMLLPGLYTGVELGWLDAVFTATSAVCVTGLIVVDTATFFTFWGQLWILLLFQLGGIGLITLTTAIIGAMGRRLSLRSEMTSVPGAQREDGQPVWQLARRVTRFTVAIESIAALALFLLWLPRFATPEAAWHAIFQSVSAFCNAGFSTFSDSLEGFNESPASLLIMSALIVTGGLGFLALGELGRWWRHGGLLRRRRLSSHSYACVVTTVALLLIGTIAYAALEWNGTLAPFALHERVVNAWFMSTTARTAGFNSISYAEIGNAAGLLTILLMFVGGSPGSTAGGLKTTTVVVLASWAWSRTRGRRFVEIHGRAVPAGTLERSVSLTLLAIVIVTLSFFALSVAQDFGGGAAEHAAFLPTAFECVSAFSTVGLSMGTTGTLEGPGKAVVIVLMFVGRVGLLAFFSAIFLRRRSIADFHPAREDLIVG
jgi:trk system potassium uptake protein TrkH